MATPSEIQNYLFILQTKTCSAISVPTFLSVFNWKCVALIRDFIVPKSCSTVWQRSRILAGFPLEPRLHSLKDGFVLPP
jgi:hypothetical protein